MLSLRSLKDIGTGKNSDWKDWPGEILSQKGRPSKRADFYTLYGKTVGKYRQAAEW